ncbi:MAG: hypothetical protein ACLPYS_09770 [Vulcanimicrobiaceae bacterium]|jgi:hypothetical protein
MTQDDLLIAARALSFLQPAPAGPIRVGIVYASSDPRSVEEADNLQQLLAGGLRVGNLIMLPVKVKIEDLAAANVQVVLLTGGVGNDGRISVATKAKRIPCITDDIAQVEDGNCAMGVRSQPRIEIFVNRAAAANSGTSFATVFRMLITEI